MSLISSLVCLILYWCCKEKFSFGHLWELKGCVKNLSRIKRPESKLHRKYVLNKPQHLATIKTADLHKIPNKEKKNLKYNHIKETTKIYARKMSVLVRNVEVNILWGNWLICAVTRAMHEYKKRLKGERKRKIVILERDFLHLDHNNLRRIILVSFVTMLPQNEVCTRKH